MQQRHHIPGVRHHAHGRSVATDRVRRITATVATGGVVGVLALIGLAFHETPSKHAAPTSGSSSTGTAPSAGTASGGASPTTGGTAGGGAVSSGTAARNTSGGGTTTTAPAATTAPAHVATGQS